MPSFLCFICHSTVNSDTNEDTREKYRDVVGMNLCPDSHLCYICCHVMNKLWLFKSVCLKRSLEYPVLFSERGTLNLQRNDLEFHTICADESCGHYHNHYVNSNTKSYHFLHDISSLHYSANQDYVTENHYVKLQEERMDLEDYFNINDIVPMKQILFDSKTTQTDFCDDDFVDDTNNDNDHAHDDNVIHENSDDVDEAVVDLNNKEDFKVTNPNGDEIVNSDVKFVVEADPIIETANIEDVNIKNEIETTKEIEMNNEYDIKNEIDTNKDVDTCDNLDEEVNNSFEEIEKKKRKRKDKNSSPVDKKRIAKRDEKILTLEEQKAELERRRREKKYIESEFKCYNCALGFLFKDTYQAHMMRHEESNGEHVCPVCSLRFAMASLLRAHAGTHGRAPPPRPSDARACHLCGQLLRNAAGLQQHLKRVHHAKKAGKTYPCTVCGEIFDKPTAVRTHMIKHVNRKFACDKCPATFSSPYTLSQHKKKHDLPDYKQYYCEQCDVAYSSQKGLLAHRRNSINHQQVILECPVCKHPCAHHRALTAHVQSAHGARLHRCVRCARAFTTAHALRKHVRRHGGKAEGGVAVCHVCGSSFKGTNKLNRHLREVCEKAKLEEEFANLYQQECMNARQEM